MRRPALRFAAIAAFTALLIVLPLLVLAALTGRTVDDQLAERAEQERIRTSQVAARSIDSALETASENLKLVAKGLPVRDALARRDGAELERHLADLKSASALYASGAARSPDGTLVAAVPLAAGEVQNAAALERFRGAIASTTPFVSEVYRSTAPPFAPLVAVAFAVRDGTRVLGVIELTLAPDDVLRSIDPVSQSSGRSVVVADRADRVIASTESSRAVLSDAGLGPLWGQAGGRAAFRAVIDGDGKFVTAIGLRLADWTLYVIDDAAVVLAVQQQLMRQRLTATAVTALVAVLFGILLAVLYERPARQRDALHLARNELAAANDGLAAASRHKSAFLSGMSHELRTPLNAILGFSELLDEQVAGLDDRQRRYLKNIQDAGNHLLALINDVLDLAKVEAGRIELRPERISAQAALEPVLAAARAAAAERGVHLDAVIGTAMLNVDVGRLRQILYNLLSNAVKFTPPDGRVGVGLRTDGSDLRVEVTDTGIGIPDDRRSRVFGEFERVNEDRSESTGTGLGLAVTKQLVDVHGGTITFESVEGRGTTFLVALPGVVIPPISGERVLVVEDDARDAELALAVAEGLGIRAELVINVGDAIAAIHRAPPVAVILDLRLGQGRGESVLRDLRTHAVTRAIPVAIVSVEDDDGSIPSIGADAYFTKPVDRERLAEWLRRVAERAAVSPAA